MSPDLDPIATPDECPERDNYGHCHCKREDHPRLPQAFEWEYPLPGEPRR